MSIQEDLHKLFENTKRAKKNLEQAELYLEKMVEQQKEKYNTAVYRANQEIDCAIQFRNESRNKAKKAFKNKEYERGYRFYDEADLHQATVSAKIAERANLPKPTNDSVEIIEAQKDIVEKEKLYKEACRLYSERRKANDALVEKLRKDRVPIA